MSKGGLTSFFIYFLALRYDGNISLSINLRMFIQNTFKVLARAKTSFFLNKTKMRLTSDSLSILSYSENSLVRLHESQIVYCIS